MPAPRRRLTLHLAIAVVAFAVALPFPPPVSAGSTSNFDQAQKLYATGDIINALKFLDVIERTNASDPAVHYLRANCLVLLKRPQEAVSEYALVQRLSPKSNLAKYSQTAIARLTSMFAGQSATKTPGNARTVTGASGAGQTTENDDDDSENDNPASGDKIARPAENTASVPAATIETIRKQAAQARARQAEIGRAEAAGEIQKANNQVKTLQERAERMAAQGRGSTEPTAQLSPEQIEAIRAQTAQNAERLKELGKFKADVKQWEAQEKVDELKQQAENLEDRLLHDPIGPVSNVRLNPIGTNLYTRNYASVPSKTIPLRAQAKTLSAPTGADLQTSGAFTPGRTNSTNTSAQMAASSARARNGVTGQNHVVSSVKGQVLPKK